MLCASGKSHEGIGFGLSPNRRNAEERSGEDWGGDPCVHDQWVEVDGPDDGVDSSQSSGGLGRL